MQNDPDPVVRREAALGMGRMDRLGLIDCVHKMLDGQPDRQQRALEAIDNVQSAGLELLDSDRLVGSSLRWRLAQFVCGRNRLRRNSMTLYAALGGSIGAAIGGTLGAAWSLPGSQVQYLPIIFMLSVIMGLAIGTGVKDLDLGQFKAMGERRRFYVTDLLAVRCPRRWDRWNVVRSSGGHTDHYTLALLGAAVGLAGGIAPLAAVQQSSSH